jgi:hypothetical protein
MIVAFVFGLVVSAESRFLAGAPFPGMVFLTTCIVFYFILVVGAQTRTRRAFSMLGNCYYGDMTFETSTDGLIISGSHFSKTYKYSAFIRVVMLKNQIIIQTGEMCGYQLPFSEEKSEEAQEFHKDLKQFIVDQPEPPPKPSIFFP